jgi:hypothetical protein
MTPSTTPLYSSSPQPLLPENGGVTRAATSVRPIRGAGIPANLYLAPLDENPAQYAENRDLPYGTSALPAWAANRVIAEFCPDHALTAIIDHGPSGNPSKIRTRLFTPRHLPGTGTVLDTVTDPTLECDASRGAASLALAILHQDAAPRETPAEPGTKSTDRDWLAHIGPILQAAWAVLREGGVLAVPVPRPTPGPGFTDPTGAIISAARAAGFSYLQHIVMLDAAIDGDTLTAALPQELLADLAITRQFDTPVHARIHTDLLALTKQKA